MINELFNLDGNVLKELFDRYNELYEILPNIHDYILELGPKLGDDYKLINENIWIHKTATIGQGVEIVGPAIIMENATIRHNAFLRENVIVGKNSVVGNSCEIKNSILIGDTEVPHFNYVGDSILGNHTHLGAGVILSNLRLDKKNIQIQEMNTNLRKIGAFIGDNAQIGCNSVLCPGTIIYPNILVYPQMVVKGIIKENIKKDNIEVKRI